VGWGGVVHSVVSVVTGKLEAPKLSCVMAPLERRWRMPCSALERSLGFPVLPLFLALWQVENPVQS
jgi:hypothetical protein